MRVSRILKELLYDDISDKALLFNGGLKYIHTTRAVVNGYPGVSGRYFFVGIIAG